ncbi:unnamed protein product [Durusdinium trenchii]|uniref:Uncharacterized protein n=1 Tax=Durusdinium trenchii TaxID=1381693 RepID=A0ABP0M184_9DINO
MVDVLQATVQEILNEISRLEKGQAAGTEDYVQLLSDVERKAPLLGRRTVPLELLKHLDEGGSLESWCVETEPFRPRRCGGVVFHSGGEQGGGAVA